MNAPKQVLYACLAVGIGTIASSYRSGDLSPAGQKARTITYGDTSVKTVKDRISWIDFESGYAQAVRENKMLLVDVYTDWCGWCKVMDRETYSNDTIIQKVNAAFVTVKLNPEKARSYKFGEKTMAADELHRWLGYGETFGYPSTYFMVGPGKTEERYAQVGYLDVAQFSKILDIVIKKKSK